jgi:hypothetical protein
MNQRRSETQPIEGAIRRLFALLVAPRGVIVGAVLLVLAMLLICATILIDSRNDAFERAKAQHVQ